MDYQVTASTHSALPDYSAQGYKDIIVTLQDPGIAIVLVNRPKQRNAINGQIANDLVQAFDLFDKDDRVRVVILSADIRVAAFCPGADISGGWEWMWDPKAEKEGEQAHRDDGGRIVLAALRCRKITIAAVNGDAAGVGITALQLPMDFRFIWQGAKLVFPFVRRGISPESASTYLLPKLLGHSRATSLLLSGSLVSPTDPLVSSLYHTVLPTRESVLPHAIKFAEDLCLHTSQTAVAYTKALLQHPGKSVEENHLLDSRSIRLLASRADAQEGVKAFKERREPKFTDKLSAGMGSWYPWWRIMATTHRAAKL